MARNLTVVPADASPSGQSAKSAKKSAPRTLTAAVELSERVLLVSMRAKVAAEIDAGVPAHALGGLMSRLRDFDKEIRLLDARAKEDAGSDDASVDDGDFDASAV